MFQSIFQKTIAESNWSEVAKLGSENAPALFPIGVIEEHGPQLPLGADIYWSYAMCRMVKEKLKDNGKQSVILPPYYWGVNYCTGSFPGSFSLKPETMKQVLIEILENAKSFSFSHIYCFNYHGDAAHVTVILDAIKEVNKVHDIAVKFMINQMDLPLYGLSGDEEYLLVVNPDYPMEWFEEEEPSERGLLDIHAGAFETAVLHHFCPELVDLEITQKLESTSLNEEGLSKWLQGGMVMKNELPLGYAGNPAGYKAVAKHVEEMLALQIENIQEQICEDIMRQR